LHIRLQKYLSQAGVASRRACENIILQGRVKVNGKTVNKLGTKVDPYKDQIEVDGSICHTRAYSIYIIMNKPKGILTTVKDPLGRPTVIDLLKGSIMICPRCSIIQICTRRLFPHIPALFGLLQWGQKP
jgi:23S rRNA pseudouridine2605 synthase